LPDADTLYRFLTTHCFTFNEANSVTEVLPDKEYIQWYCHIWRENAVGGEAIIIQKSRRLIMSWVETALELFLMGAMPSSGVVCGLNYSKASEHVWRFYHYASEMVKRFPGLLPEGSDPSKWTRGGNVATKKIDSFMLPNGSIVNGLNQEGQSFQGSGYTFVRTEELSQYRYVNYFFAQSKIVCQGKPGERGGFRVHVTNAYPNVEYKLLKEI